ncbi:MAG: hypothetical protein Q8M24_20185 [Pseudolabrys sp.]|nr:hypothetical protein [Pseudolabrys sp.]MDP2297769.1 hypothetical protein [Pseudolabrys sp.]
MTSEFRSGVAALALLAAGLLLAPGHALAAGGAFAVDDSEVGKPGECKVESWVSFAGNRDLAAATSPACVVNLGIPVDIGGQLQRSRSDSEWGTSGALKAKVNIISAEGHAFGLGLSGGSGWDLITGASTGGFINVPVTFQLREDFKININGGWMYDATTKISYATWGAGFEWNFNKALPLTLIGEVYGQEGRLAPVEPDAAPANNSVREPRTQLGLRYTPKENIDVDVIWGRNITGENSNWLTLGVNLRF